MREDEVRRKAVWFRRKERLAYSTSTRSGRDEATNNFVTTNIIILPDCPHEIAKKT